VSIWEEYVESFKSGYLLAHKMGEVDEDYVKKANDPQAVLG